jgi:hypothetical protein
MILLQKYRKKNHINKLKRCGLMGLDGNFKQVKVFKIIIN